MTPRTARGRRAAPRPPVVASHVATLVALVALTVLAAAATGPLGRPALASSAPLPPPAAPAADPADRTALQGWGSCASAQGAGDLLLLIDQSQSLSGTSSTPATDPDDVRVQAASYLVQEMGRWAGEVGAALDVAVAGFDVGYEQVVDWQRLDEASGPEIGQGLQTFAQRDDGLDTDYVAALDGARAALRDKAAGRSPSPCQALLWFSDGRLDIEPRGPGSEATKPYAPGIRITDEAAALAVEDEAVNSLCRPGGLADQLRVSGVVTLGVGLGDSDFRLMRTLATGEDTGLDRPCGEPVTEPVGDFHLAADAGDLIFELGRITDPGQPPVDLEQLICGGDACPEGTHQFVLDASVRSVKVLADLDRPGVEVWLRGPDAGAPLSLSASTVEGLAPDAYLGNAVSARLASERAVHVTIERRPGSAWTGPWTIVFVDPAAEQPGGTARAQLRIEGDLVPVVPSVEPGGRLQLRSGDPATVQLGMRSQVSGQPVTAEEILGTATLSAVLALPGAEPVTLADGPVTDVLARPLAVDLDGVSPGSGRLVLGLSVTTADVPAAPGRPAIPGTRLAESPGDVAVDVLAPLNYPTLGATSVNFGAVEGVGPLTAALAVTGPGCVWVDGADVGPVPAEAGTVTAGAVDATDADSCLRLDAGQQGNLDLTLAVENVANATIGGTFTVALAPLEDAGQAVTAPVAFLGEVTKPADVGTRWGVFALALALGLLLPLAFLYAMKWWTAKIPGLALLGGVAAARVNGDAVLRDGRAFTASLRDVSLLRVDRSGSRAVAVTDGVSLRTRIGLTPTSTGYTQVIAPGRRVVTVADDGRDTDRLPLAVHNTWAALVGDPSSGTVEILLLSSANAGEETWERITREVRDTVPRMLRTLREQSAPDRPDGPSADAGLDAGGLDAGRPSAGGLDAGRPSAGGAPAVAPLSPGPAAPPGGTRSSFWRPE